MIEVGAVYTYKGKFYKVLHLCKIKYEGKWVQGVVYEALYEVPDGNIFVRENYTFLLKFKKP